MPSTFNLQPEKVRITGRHARLRTLVFLVETMRTPIPSLLRSAFAAAAVLAPLAAAAPVPSKRPAVPAAKVDFNAEIRPILSTSCFPCHGADESTRAAGLRLDLRDEAVRDRSGRRAIVPGKPALSRVVARITEAELARRMPPPKSGHALTPREVELLKRWIAEGASYQEHWSFKPPVAAALPKVKDARWAPLPRLIAPR
jgi:hypothetical protein